MRKPYHLNVTCDQQSYSGYDSFLNSSDDTHIEFYFRTLIEDLLITLPLTIES